MRSLPETGSRESGKNGRACFDMCVIVQLCEDGRKIMRNRQVSIVNTRALDSKVEHSCTWIRCHRCDQRCYHMLQHCEKMLDLVYIQLTSFILNSPGFMNPRTGPKFAYAVLSTDSRRGRILDQATPTLWMSSRRNMLDTEAWTGLNT